METDDATPDDAALMEQIARGDEAAFRAFYRRHSSTAFSLCLRVLRNQADAEDVLAEVFFELWEKSDRYDASKATPYTYLMVLARSRAIDQYRRRQSGLAPASGGCDEASRPRREELIASNEANPAGAAEAGELRARVVELLGALDAKHREALQLAYYEGLTHREIAERTGWPLGTVKSNIRIAMTKLRSGLRPTYDLPPPS